jgi:SAM-dependent methyltransferase
VTVSAFDHALGGNPALLLRSDGGAVRLDVARWNDSASPEDAWLLDRCSGAVVDLGCGPGRLLTALADRGVQALGIDVSPEAETRCRRRGVPMLRADLFAPLPGEGRWDHVLLADGNIGIGGDPARLLRRADQLLRRGGSVLVETEPDPDTYWLGSVRVATVAGLGGIGLRTGAVRNGHRCFVELRAGERLRRR